MALSPRQITRALDRVLHKVEQPARYTGGELNSIAKDWADPSIHTKVALAFPEEPPAIQRLMGNAGQTIQPGGALQPVLEALWREAEQRAAWGFVRLVTQCRPMTAAAAP